MNDSEHPWSGATYLSDATIFAKNHLKSKINMKKLKQDVDPSTPAIVMNVMIALDKLKPNSYNARKSVDKNKISELKDSILKHGIIVPLIVRPLPDSDDFEIIGGWRRYSAAVLAKINELPCQVRDLNDSDAYEIMIIENLHREEIHPLDEARAFKFLLKEQKLEDIARKINKSESYVSKRLVLNKLIKSAEDAFYSGQIHLGQAFLISRQAPIDQERIMKENWETFPERHFSNETKLRQWIFNNLFLDLKNAPFDLDDSELNPKMGTCTTCQFRTKNVMELFEDVSGKDRCTVPSCFKIKTDVNLKNVQVKMKEEHGQVLAGATTWRDGAVKVGGKEVPVVKKGPDTIPVVISKVDNYSKEEKKNIGKVVYINKDYNKPVEEEVKPDKNVKNNVNQKQQAFRIHLFIQILKIVNTPKSVSVARNADKVKEIFIEEMLRDGSIGDFGDAMPVLCDYYEVHTREPFESWEEFINEWDKLAFKMQQTYLKDVQDKLVGLSPSLLITLFMAADNVGRFGDVDKKTTFWKICATMEMNVAVEKSNFSKIYDKWLADRNAALKNVKSVGDVVKEVKKSKK
jgi:ParB/RepB/Spo0J family partition protein